VASRQKGLVSRRQLVALAVSPGTIDRWVTDGRLHVVYPGVYLVGHAARLPFASELAAVLALGEGALLSHRSAAVLWELVKRRPGFHPQVTVHGRRVRGPRGIGVHYTEALDPDEVTEEDGVPVTSPLRTLFDFAGQASAAEVGRAYEEGLIRKRFDRAALIAYSRRRAGRRGRRKIAALIERDAPPSVTIEEAHRRLLELIRRSDLPHPRTEVPLGRYRADILWPEAKLVVEMDGGAFHNLPSRIERDKLRDAELAARGYLTIRVTWRQLTTEPAAVIARIRATLAHRVRAHRE
jgi:very-short-patch-repair endonuclease